MTHLARLMQYGMISCSRIFFLLPCLDFLLCPRQEIFPSPTAKRAKALPRLHLVQQSPLHPKDRPRSNGGEGNKLRRGSLYRWCNKLSAMRIIIQHVSRRGRDIQNVVHANSYIVVVEVTRGGVDVVKWHDGPELGHKMRNPSLGQGRGGGARGHAINHSNPRANSFIRTTLTISFRLFSGGGSCAHELYLHCHRQ
jgi:hypothetical protein